MEQQYRVTPAIGVNIRSGPGTDWPKTGGYARGTVVQVREERSGWGRTPLGWVSLAHLEPADGPADRVTDTGIPIRVSLIPAGNGNRPGGVNPCRYITIHETGNRARGADAAAHASYLKSVQAEESAVSWHYTVDDGAIVQHLPDGERAYHAGDGAKGPGNAESIGVEICVNADGNFERAKANAAALVRLLTAEHGVPPERVVQHHRWNGKDCPRTLRHTAGAWERFLEQCSGTSPADDPLRSAVDVLAAAGVVTAPDYWKAGNWSRENVAALIRAMAAYVEG